MGTRFFKVMNPGVISKRQVSNIDAERGNLLGSRIAIFKELAPGEALKTNEVQLLSGGDGIPATPKYKDPMTIVPHHLCILETNHMPELDVILPAIVERLLCIHFPVSFTTLEPGEEPSEFRQPCDNTLNSRMKGKHAEVFKWLVDGAVRWYATRSLKRSAPPEVKEFTQAYFADQDVLSQFLSVHCELGHTLEATTTQMLARYNVWLMEQGGDKKADSKKLAAEMKTKGFEKIRKKVNGGPRDYYFVGVGLLPEGLFYDHMGADDV